MRNLYRALVCALIVVCAVFAQTPKPGGGGGVAVLLVYQSDPTGIACAPGTMALFDLAFYPCNPATGQFEASAAPVASGVASFKTRTGAVVPASGDYTDALVSNTSAIAGATVKAALDAISTALAGKQATIGASDNLSTGSWTLTPASDRDALTARCYANDQTNPVSMWQRTSNGLLRKFWCDGSVEELTVESMARNASSSAWVWYYKTGKGLCWKYEAGAEVCAADSATWGSIGGTLANQTDLNTALAAKADAAATTTALAAKADDSAVVKKATNNTYSAGTYQDLNVARLRIPEAQFASAPATPVTGQVWLFTDASSAGTCSGGGTAQAICRWDGAAWKVTSGSSTGATYSAGTGINIADDTISIDSAVAQTRANTQSGADLKPTITSSSGTTFTATMSPTLTEHTDGMEITFAPNQTPTGTVTLSIDTLLNDGGANPPKVYGANGTSAFRGVSGRSYKLKWDTALDGGDGGWRLLSSGEVRVLGITVDGGGSAITTGVKGYAVVPFDCVIQSWSVVADQSGSIVFDVWKHTAVPTVGNTITASAKPTLSSAQLAVAQAPTGWTTAVSANDVIGFNVDSATTVTRATLTIACQR